MKKLLLILFISIAFSDSIVFIGESKGELITGFSIELTLDDNYFSSKVTLREMELKEGFGYGAIQHDIELGNDIIGWKHRCTHGVDAYKPIDVIDEYMLKYKVKGVY